MSTIQSPDSFAPIRPDHEHDHSGENVPTTGHTYRSPSFLKCMFDSLCKNMTKLPRNAEA